MHLRVHSRCGLCGFLFCAGDRFYTLTNEGQSWPVQLVKYGVFSFPESRYCASCGDERLCRIPDCKGCRQSKETSTIHASCMALFLSQMSRFCSHKTKISIQDKCCLLWVAATWKNLWQGYPYLNIQPKCNIYVSDIDTIVEDLGGLEAVPGDINTVVGEFGGLEKQLQKLPRDIYFMIQDLCNDSWYCSVLHLGRQMWALQENSDHRGQMIPLVDIKAWVRGDAPLVGDTSGEPVVRLSIDLRGLERIERLEKAEDSRRSNHMCYIVEVAERFKGVSVEFQFGMARLRGVTGPIHIWDTPCPPPLFSSIVDHDITTRSDDLQAWHLGTVDLSLCTGMTLFVSLGSTYAVHVHTMAQPFAYRTFLSLPLERRKVVAWIYVPIQGQVEELGFTKLPNRPGNFIKPQHLLIRFDSGVDVLIGSYEKEPRDFVSLRWPQTLIYRKNDTLPIDFVGAVSKNKKNKLRNKTAPRWSIPSQPTLEKPRISSASLEDVFIIKVYRVSGTDLCRGLIIQYKKGGKLALGQCRLGVDDLKEYKWPARLCFTKEMAGVKVECLEDHNHVHKRTVWTCCKMSGVLYCWFNQDEIMFEHR